MPIANLTVLTSVLKNALSALLVRFAVLLAVILRSSAKILVLTSLGRRMLELERRNNLEYYYSPVV